MPVIRQAPIIDVGVVLAKIEEAVLRGVNEVATDAHHVALDLVPVRKVFRYGRKKSGERFQGRQDIRPLSLEEALTESVMRRRLGLPSAFLTDTSGRRLPGRQPVVQTAQLTERYRSLNRANSSRELQQVHNRRSANVVPVRDRWGRLVGTAFALDDEATRDLNAQGRSALRTGRGIFRKGDEITLGGALRSTVVVELATAGPVFEATVSAGSDEVDYAKYVEFGTRRSRAQPFLRPALARAREELMSRVKSQIENAGR